jgi:hypothetical protein
MSNQGAVPTSSPPAQSASAPETPPTLPDLPDLPSCQPSGSSDPTYHLSSPSQAQSVVSPLSRSSQEDKDERNVDIAAWTFLNILEGAFRVTENAIQTEAR